MYGCEAFAAGHIVNPQNRVPEVGYYICGNIDTCLMHALLRNPSALFSREFPVATSTQDARLTEHACLLTANPEAEI